MLATSGFDKPATKNPGHCVHWVLERNTPYGTIRSVLFNATEQEAFRFKQRLLHRETTVLRKLKLGRPLDFQLGQLLVANSSQIADLSAQCRHLLERPPASYETITVAKHKPAESLRLMEQQTRMEKADLAGFWQAWEQLLGFSFEYNQRYSNRTSELTVKLDSLLETSRPRLEHIRKTLSDCQSRYEYLMLVARPEFDIASKENYTTGAVFIAAEADSQTAQSIQDFMRHKNWQTQHCLPVSISNCVWQTL